MSRKRVLLIDDQLAQAEAIKGYFTRFGHRHEYEVETAVDGPQIVAAVQRGLPELLLIDPQIKSMNGILLLKQVRGLDSTMPVIVITGKQPTQVAAEVLKTGVFAYVPKPCDYQQLEHLVALAVSAPFKAAGSW